MIIAINNYITEKGLCVLRRILFVTALLLALCGYAWAAVATEARSMDATEIEDVMDEGDAMLTAEPEPEELTQMGISALTALAESGNSEAQLVLGDRYYYGKGGVNRDRYQAFKWYALAAEQDCTASQFNLAHMYRNGAGTTQNMQKALEWFEKAAYLGDAESQFMAAEMLGAGSGVAQNNVRAYMWYKIAYTTMEPRFRGIAKAELDLLKPHMSKAEVAEAEALVIQWHEIQVKRMRETQN